MNNFGGGFNVLEDAFQRHVLAGTPRLQGLAAKRDHTQHVNMAYYFYLTYTAYIYLYEYTKDQEIPLTIESVYARCCKNISINADFLNNTQLTLPNQFSHYKKMGLSAE